jgi:C4-type Zn-finger protein
MKEEVKTPPPPPAPVIKPVPVLTLEQKLEKVDELNRIIAKYQRLMDARKNLNTFKIGSDGLNLTIIIKDASGQEFKTSHNVVVETVLSTVRQILNERISDVEKDINFSD